MKTTFFLLVFSVGGFAAFIEGSEKPEEILVISAHLDHEGVKNGEVYNGADDDGSGTVAIVEIAEAFKMAEKAGHGPKRSNFCRRISLNTFRITDSLDEQNF